MKTGPKDLAAGEQQKGTRVCVVPTVAQASRAIIKTKTSGCKHNNGVLMTVEEGNRLEKWKLQQKRNA